MIPFRTEALVQDLEALPAQQAVALRVLHVSSDPRSSASDLASVLMADPAITAQIIKLANSAYYGLSGRVGSVPFAVTVVGFLSIRSVVAAFAAGAMGQDVTVPDGLWERAAANASAASILGPRLGTSRPDAFSLGLLHEIGGFLLHRVAPEAHHGILADAPHWDCRARARLERQIFDTDHGEVLARCLANWSFPEDLVHAVEHHTSMVSSGSPLGRVLVAGNTVGALALHADDERPADPTVLTRIAKRLAIGGIDLDDGWAMSRHARHDAALLAASFVVD